MLKLVSLFFVCKLFKLCNLLRPDLLVRRFERERNLLEERRLRNKTEAVPADKGNDFKLKNVNFFNFRKLEVEVHKRMFVFSTEHVKHLALESISDPDGCERVEMHRVGLAELEHIRN